MDSDGIPAQKFVGEHSFLVTSLKGTNGEEYILKVGLRFMSVKSQNHGKQFAEEDVTSCPHPMSVLWSLFIFTPLSG